MSRGENDPQVSEAEMTEARLRRKRACEAVGKTREDLGEFVCNSPTYYDLEACNGDLYMDVGLGELSHLCSALGISARDLFGESISTEEIISPEQLLSKAREHLNRSGLSIAEFEDRIGFKIEPSLNDPSKMMDWNVDFLRWLCRELGLDWRLALP
jgi:hypothetical protein